MKKHWTIELKEENKALRKDNAKTNAACKELQQAIIAAHDRANALQKKLVDCERENKLCTEKNAALFDDVERLEKELTAATKRNAELKARRDQAELKLGDANDAIANLEDQQDNCRRYVKFYRYLCGGLLVAAVGLGVALAVTAKHVEKPRHNYEYYHQ